MAWERERLEQRGPSQDPDRHFRWVLTAMLAVAALAFVAADWLGPLH